VTVMVAGAAEKVDHAPVATPRKGAANQALLYALAFTALPQIIGSLSNPLAQNYLKNVLHIGPVTMSEFGAMIGAATYVVPFFGYLRDRWSPFRLGDRGYLVLAAPLVAAACLIIALAPETYGPFLLGAILFNLTLNMLGPVGDALYASVSREYKIQSKLATAALLKGTVLGAVIFSAGGWLADHFEYRRFLFAYALLAVPLFLFGLWRPRLPAFGGDRSSIRIRRPVVGDLKVLVRHREFWIVAVFMAIWNFMPINEQVLYFLWQNHLHLSNQTIGNIKAVSAIANLPFILGYAFMAQRYETRKILLIAILLSTFEYLPLLFAHGTASAYLSYVTVGLLGVVVSVALLDLLWRSSPSGLEGVSLSIATLITGLFVTGSGILGSWVLERYGYSSGFTIDVIIVAASSLVMLPLIRLLPNTAPR